MPSVWQRSGGSCAARSQARRAPSRSPSYAQPVALLEPELSDLEPVPDLFGEPARLAVVAGGRRQVAAAQREARALVQRDEQARPVLLRAGALLELRDFRRRGNEGAAVEPAARSGCSARSARGPRARRPPRPPPRRRALLAAPGLAGVVERRREVDREGRPLRRLVPGRPDRLLEAHERACVLAAIEQAARLLGEEPRLEPVVAGALDGRPERRIHGVLVLEVSGERVHLRPHQRRLDPLGQARCSGAVGLVEALEGAAAPALARQPDRLQAQRPRPSPRAARPGARPATPRRARDVRAVSPISTATSARRSLARRLVSASHAASLAMRSNRAFASSGRPPAISRSASSASSHGTEILAAVRGQPGGEREPGLGAQARSARDPAAGLLERGASTSRCEELFDAGAGIVRAIGQARGFAAPERRLLRSAPASGASPVASATKAREAGRGEGFASARERAMRRRRDRSGEPLVEPHRGGDRPGREPRARAATRPGRPAAGSLRRHRHDVDPLRQGQTRPRRSRAARARPTAPGRPRSRRAGGRERRSRPPRAGAGSPPRLPAAEERRPSADPGATDEPSTSKILGTDPASRARAFSQSVRARAVRSARSESPRQRCRAPDAAGRPSSGNVRKAPATQNSARRAAASCRRSWSRSVRTAGAVIRPPRSKSRTSRAASAAEGPPGRRGAPQPLGESARATGARCRRRAPSAPRSKSPASRTKPRDAKKAAAAAACRKSCAASARGTRPSAMRRPAAAPATRAARPRRARSRAPGRASRARAPRTRASARRLAAIGNRSGTPVASSVAMEPPGFCLCIVARRNGLTAGERLEVAKERGIGLRHAAGILDEQTRAGAARAARRPWRCGDPGTSGAGSTAPPGPVAGPTTMRASSVDGRPGRRPRRRARRAPRGGRSPSAAGARRPENTALSRREGRERGERGNRVGKIRRPRPRRGARGAARGRGRHSVRTVHEAHAHPLEHGQRAASASAEGQRRPASVTSPPAMPTAAASGTADE